MSKVLDIDTFRREEILVKVGGEMYSVPPIVWETEAKLIALDAAVDATESPLEKHEKTKEIIRIFVPELPEHALESLSSVEANALVLGLMKLRSEMVDAFVKKVGVGRAAKT
jgi:hypothetical protein